VSAKRIAVEVLIDLRRRLDRLPSRSPERRDIVRQAAKLYGISESTLYRQLEKLYRPKALRRADHGIPRVLPKAQMLRYCEVIAALKIRTMNKKGRHISTVRAIEVLEGQGIEIPDGLVRPEKGQLRKATVNRYLKQWGFDHRTLTYQAPAVRFQARHSNECWQLDLSPSDLKHLEEPLWHDPSKDRPILMLYSVVDDRSGVCYQEYRNVYGEDVEAALRFLFNAMSAKSDEEFALQGIPAMLYMDNGPIARSRVFQSVMAYLGVQIQLHMPDSKAKHRHTARAKGKVERAFRTVKEAHEVLYHLREPKDEGQANERLLAYLKTYNDHPHRSEPHSRMEDWQANLPLEGIRQMCSWERFCTFAREPENRKIGIDARIRVDGTVYEVHADLAGESVILWWGLFDSELFVEHEGQRYGPRRSQKRTHLCSSKRTRDLRSRLLSGAKRKRCGGNGRWGGSGDSGSEGGCEGEPHAGMQDLGLVWGGLASAFRGRRSGIVVGDAQRGAVDADGDAMMLQAVEQGIDQGLALEQLVPVRVVEVRGDDRGLARVAQVHELEEGVDLLGL